MSFASEVKKELLSLQMMPCCRDAMLAGILQGSSEIVLSNDYLENAPSFACSLEDGSDNTMFLSYARNFTFWKKFIENYRLGNVFFESIKIKNNVTPLFASLIRF